MAHKLLKHTVFLFRAMMYMYPDARAPLQPIGKTEHLHGYLLVVGLKMLMMLLFQVMMFTLVATRKMALYTGTKMVLYN
jgi:hypothetical protein